MALALFDMDGTLVRGNTGADYVKYRHKRGLLRTRQAVEAFVVYGRYRLGMVDMAAVLHEAAREVAGMPESALEAECLEIFEDTVKARICPDMRARVEQHRAAGDHLAIVTASTPYITRHLAAELGIDTIIATELEVADGCLTGKLAGIPCYGAFKIDKVRAWVQADHGRLEDAWFYSDSDSDTPLLELVGHPVVVRPDPRLRLRARMRGWERV